MKKIIKDMVTGLTIGFGIVAIEVIVIELLLAKQEKELDEFYEQENVQQILEKADNDADELLSDLSSEASEHLAQLQKELDDMMADYFKRQEEIQKKYFKHGQN